MTREAVSAKLRAHRAGKRSWPSICYPCALNPEALLQGAISSGDVQKNEATVKRRRGPEKGSNAVITEERLKQAFRTLGNYAPQEKVAEFLGVEDRSIRLWQKARGLSYRQLRQQFTETGSG
jgi:hypothetical protein